MNFKKFLLLIPILFTSLVIAMGEKKKILFIDLNNAPNEIKVAKETAKKKGEELIVYPNKNSKFEMQGLESILSQNHFQSLVLSGHNGGATYSGTKGHLELNPLIELLQKTKNTDIKSLYLLGCNTANKAKMFFWKETLPKLKFIAGYDGSAPLSTTTAGLNYFRDTMEKEDQILKSKDSTQLKKYLQGLSNINQLQSSLYISCEEGENPNDYVFFPQRKIAEEKFSVLNTKECMSRIKEFKEDYLPKIRKFWMGDLEPTAEDTKNGFLRTAYTYMRQNEHCFQDKEGLNGNVLDMDGDSLLMLLFNKGFNHSFSDYYAPLVKESIEAIKKFESNPNPVIENMMMKADENTKLIKKLVDNYPIYKQKMDQEIKNLELSIGNIERDNPEIQRCGVHFEPSCLRFQDKLDLIQSKKITIASYGNFTKEFFQMMLNQNKSFQLTKDQLIAQFQSQIPEMKKSQLILMKMQSSPDKVTRKEMLDLSHSIRNFAGINPSILGLSKALTGAEQLTNKFPFSWHERNQSVAVEGPKGSMKIENLYNSICEKPQDSELAKMIGSFLQ